MALANGGGEAKQMELQGRIDSLQPVLDKLRGLDPKTFGLLSGMLSQAEGSDANSGTAATMSAPRGASFLEFVHQAPEDAAEKLMKLAPVLDRLRGLDGKAFGALSSLVSEAQEQAVTEAAPKPEDRAAATGRRVESSALLQAGAEPETQGRSDAASRTPGPALQALRPVLDKLKGLDGKAFTKLSSMIAEAAGQ